jgi:hypothetical protein
MKIMKVMEQMRVNLMFLNYEEVFFMIIIT